MQDRVEAHEQTITLLAYPYEMFWRDALDQTFNIPYKKFDASAYASAARAPVERKFKLLTLENRYLRLSFLPELGGRLYQVLYKPTGQTLFYNNKVLKPTPWGPENQGGWIAAGGMEWALPVNEHGYEWGVPWHYKVDGQTVTLWDSDATDRVRAQISVTLWPGASYFVVRPRVTNGTRATLPIQFWINAQLALNEKNISPETEFIMRGAQVFIHSTGDDFIPAANVPAVDAKGPSNPVSWPVIGTRDLSRYSNWKDYLGLFLTGSGADYAGAYDHSNELGVVRVFPRDRVRGVKLFAWGPQFGDRTLWSDDDSDYFELWGGLPLTFYNYQDWPFAPGESREWDEYWIPIAGTGGVSGASRDAILNVIPGSPVTVRALATHALRGTLVLSRNDLQIKSWDVTLTPGQVFTQTVEEPTAADALKLVLRAPDGTLLAQSGN